MNVEQQNFASTFNPLFLPGHPQKHSVALKQATEGKIFPKFAEDLWLKAKV
jgi:hypothetical protein